MKKLLGKLKNTRKNASQVLTSVNLQLNKEETLSVEGKVRTNNTPEVNPVQHTERSLKAHVYVISKDGNL